MNFVPIIRASKRPKEAQEFLAQMGVKDVALENRLEVRASADGDHTICLMGAVGGSWWDEGGITEKEFRDALKTIPDGKQITITVNSEGGSVKDGLGIYNAIKSRAKDIRVRIEGYALSIASVFPLAAKKSLGGRGVVSPKAAIWMQHKAWSWASGNADDMRHESEVLDAHDGTLVDIYVSATGKTKAEIIAIMAKETWTKGSEAVAAGLADESDDADNSQASYRALHPDFIAKCKNLSSEILNAINPRSQTPAQQGENEQTKNENENQMNKKIIVALLVKRGVEASETETEEQLQAKLEKLLETKMKKDSSAENIEDIADIRAELAAQKKQRLSDKINAYVDQNRITKAAAKIYLAQALAGAEAETEVFAALDELSVNNSFDPSGIEFVEASAATPSGIQGSKIIPELENIFTAHKDVAARYDAMKKEFPRLIAKAFKRDNGVQNANTFSGTITTNFLIAGVITKLGPKLAALKLFTKDSAQDPYKPLAAGIRKFNVTAQDGSDVGKNVTNFTTLAGASNGNIDSTINAITITPDQYTAGGYIDNAQLNSGFRIADIVENKLRGFASKIVQVCMVPITTVNFTTNAAVISAAAAFGFSDLADLQGKLKKANVKNLLLDGEYIARIANQPGFFQMAGTVGGQSAAWKAYGWDNVALNTDWSGAGANVRGFGCGDQAIGIISGLPLNPPEGIPGNIVQTGMAVIDDVQVAIATYAWFDPTTRRFYFTYDIILGATLIDETDGCLVKSA